jgi:hypothetical protein
MPTAHSPTRPHAPETTAQPAALSFEDRLMLRDAAMTVALDRAAVAYEVNTAHIPSATVALPDVITQPVNPPAALPEPFPTPVAALLQRAHHRLQTSGWCSGALVDEDGKHCMLGAIRAEADGDRGLERRAVDVLMDVLRREFGDTVDSVPAFNDAFGTGGIPARMLDRAAGLADARGL